MLALPYYEEVWRDIKGYEGLYQVSNFGRVKSLDHYSEHYKGGVRLIKGCLLNPVKTDRGYLTVRLYKNSKSKYYKVHRLVAEAFIPNPHNHPTVDHKNRIRTDNREENLRWAPMKLQCKNRDNKPIIKGIKKLLSKPVKQYTMDIEFVAEYTSVSEAARQTGYCISSISKCCRGGYKQYNNYIWRYA